MTNNLIEYDDKKHIMFNEFTFIARVKDEIIEKWINENKLVVLSTNVGKVFTRESVKTILSSPEFVEERNNSLVVLTNEEYKEIEIENDKLIYNLRYFINKIVSLHQKYKYKFNIKSETAELASYLLFAKAINLLFVIINSLQQKYLNGFGLFRVLNEAIQLAEYFLVIKNENRGKRELNAWFRKEISPKMEIVRRLTNTYSDKLLPDELKLFYKVHRILLHNVQSKSIHNTFNDTYKLIAFEPKENCVEAFIEYDKTSNVIELNQTLKYLLYNLPTLIIGFQFCYQIVVNILDDNDIKEIEKLLNEIAKERISLKKFKNVD